MRSRKGRRKRGFLFESFIISIFTNPFRICFRANFNFNIFDSKSKRFIALRGASKITTLARDYHKGDRNGVKGTAKMMVD